MFSTDSSRYRNSQLKCTTKRFILILVITMTAVTFAIGLITRDASAQSGSISAPPMPGTLLYDHFGVTLAISATQNTSIGRNSDGGYTFDWNSFEPTKNTDTVDWLESDWIGAWNDDFTDTTVQHAPAPGTPDLDYVPAGGEPYDTEAIYFDNDADNYYIAIVTSVPHLTSNGVITDVGIIDPRDSLYGAAIRTGDLSMNFYEGAARTEKNSTTWNYNYGVDLIHEDRDSYELWDGFAQRPVLHDTELGTGVYQTSSDAGGTRVDGPSALGDWYTSASNLSTEGLWEHSNFDPLSSSFSGSLLGNAIVNYYEYDFGGLEENDYPTYVYEITIPRSLFGANDREDGENIGLRFTPGCRNDGNGVGDGSVNLIATVDDPVNLGNYVVIESDNDGNATTGSTIPVTNTTVIATSTNSTIYTATTDVNGFYTITVPANDTYTVTVGIPADSAVSIPSGGLVNIDNDSSSDNNIAHDPTGTAVTVGTDDNYTIDFVFHKVVNIGDYIWLESDGDGDANTGVVTTEAGILITATASNGTFYTTTTDANGLYSITVLANATYTLSVEAPIGYVPSTIVPLAGENENHDSSGIVVVVNTMDITDIDFGFYQPVQLGDRVWLESDGDGDATTGSITAQADILVTATASNGTIYTATTDVNGLYTITVPANATYTVTVESPVGYTPSTVILGAINNQNHDASGTVVVVGLTDVTDIDFGFRLLSMSLALEKTLITPANGIALVGDILTFRLQITNIGELTVTELNLIDSYDPTIFQYLTATVTPDSQTADSITWAGDYSAGTGSLLPNLPLAPGATFTITVNMEAIAPTRP